MTAQWRGIVVVSMGLTVAACSGSSPAPTTPPAPAAQAAGAAGAAPTDLHNPDVPIFSVSDADRTSGRGPCVFNPASGQFDCPSETRDGITYTSRYTLYDASGQVQSAFNRATTASIKTETTASGTTTGRDGGTSTINRTGVMTTTGLGPAATAHTLNGTETGTVVTTRTANGVTVTTNTSINDTTTNLVVPVRSDRDAAAYPLSGSRVHATATTTTNRGETRTSTTKRQETFNGTSTVQVEITINGATERCSYDLAARTSTCGSR